jgi:beta-lactamase regulating signal transducer with metallopeptidase domain
MDSYTLLLILARVTVVALIGRLLMMAMARAAASARYLVAVITFCSMLAVPLLSAAGVQWRIALLPPPPSERSELAKIDPPEPPGGAALVASVARAAEGAGAWQGWLAEAILAVAAIFVARMLFGILAIRWITGKAREIEDDALARDFDFAAQRLGVDRMVRLLVSERVTVPLVWGIRKPALLLPAAALEWSRDRLRVVFAHELAHLRRGDAVTLLLTRSIAALYWFHPLAWSLDRAARRDCEQACDDLVLASGTRASDYADHLLGIARSLPARDPFGAVTLAMSRRSQLEGRLLSILQADIRRGGVSRGAAAVAAVVAALLVLPIAAIRLTAQPAPPEPPHASAQKTDAHYEQYYEQGKQYLRARDYVAAIHAFADAVKSDPFAGSAWYNLACARALAGERDRALDTLESAVLHGFNNDGEQISKDPDLDSLHGPRFDGIVRLADDLALQNSGKEWQTAIPRYERYAHAHPDIARAWFNYGFVLAEGGQSRAAVSVFDKVLAMDYRPATTMYNLACAYALAGERQAALSWLRRSAQAGFDVGGFAKADKDLESVRDDQWLGTLIAEARHRKDDKQNDK